MIGRQVRIVIVAEVEGSSRQLLVEQEKTVFSGILEEYAIEKVGQQMWVSQLDSVQYLLPMADAAFEILGEVRENSFPLNDAVGGV